MILNYIEIEVRNWLFIKIVFFWEMGYFFYIIMWWNFERILWKYGIVRINSLVRFYVWWFIFDIDIEEMC